MAPTQLGGKIGAKRVGWAIILILLALLIAILTSPMRIAIAWGGLDGKEGGGPLTMRGVAGSIWNGKLYSAQLGPIALGDVKAQLQPWPLLTGQSRLSLTFGGADGDQRATGRATLIRSADGFGITDMSGRVPVGGWLSPLPAPVAEFEGFSARFVGGRCAEAGGLVKMQMASPLPGLNLTNGLTAAPRCSGERVLIPFKGESGMEQLNIYVAADGSYRATLRLEGLPDIAAPVLTARGFSSDGAAWVLSVEGRF